MLFVVVLFLVGVECAWRLLLGSDIPVQVELQEFLYWLGWAIFAFIAGIFFSRWTRHATLHIFYSGLYLIAVTFDGFMTYDGFAYARPLLINLSNLMGLGKNICLLALSVYGYIHTRQRRGHGRIS